MIPLTYPSLEPYSGFLISKPHTGLSHHFLVFWEWLGYMIIPCVFSEEGLAVRKLLIEYNFYEELQ